MTRGLVGVGRDQRLDLLLESVEGFGRRDPPVDEERPCPQEWISLGLLRSLGLGPIRPLVVRHRVGIWSDRMRVDERGPLPRATVRHGLPGSHVAVHHVGAVALSNEKIRKAFDELGDTPARRVDLHGNRDGIPVVLDQEHDWELEITGDVQCLPELTPRGGSIPCTDQNDFVLPESGDLVLELRNSPDVLPGLGGSHGREELGSSGRRCAGDVEPYVSEVRRHLPACAVRIVVCPHGPEEMVEGRLPDGEG